MGAPTFRQQQQQQRGNDTEQRGFLIDDHPFVPLENRHLSPVDVIGINLPEIKCAHPDRHIHRIRALGSEVAQTGILKLRVDNRIL